MSNVSAQDSDLKKRSPTGGCRRTRRRSGRCRRSQRYSQEPSTSLEDGPSHNTQQAPVFIFSVLLQPEV